MGYDHRGRPLGRNYRPTPRLAALVARQMNRDYRLYNPLDEESKLRPEVTSAQAQNLVDNYRERRDRPSYKYGETNDFGVPNMADQIGTAFYGRNSRWGYQPRGDNPYSTE